MLGQTNGRFSEKVLGVFSLRAMWLFLRGQRTRLLFGMALLGLQAGALLPIAPLLHAVLSVQIPGSDTRAVLLSGFGILGLYTASTALSLGARRLILASLFDSLAALRLSVFARLHDLPLAWHEQQDVGELHSTLALDGERLETCLPSLVLLLQAIVVGLPLTVVAVIISPALAGVVAVLTPAMLLLNAKLKGRTRRAITGWRTTCRVYSTHVLRTLRSMQLIRSRGVDAAELEEMNHRIAALARNGLDRSWASSLTSVVNSAIAGVVGCAVLVVGGVQVTLGALTLSELLTFYAVILLALRNVTGAAGSGANLMVASASLIPLQEIIENPQAPIYSGTQRKLFDGAVTLSGVTFGYGAAPVFDGLELEVAAGECVAVVGRNGSGKSTLARLVLGLDRPWTGTVSASGYPLDELDMAALRRQIGVVPQEASIRPGTIRENITFGRPDLTEAHVARALAMAGVTDMLDHRFPDGIETDIGDDGAKLSGGQRQAISLARALVGDPRLLILDEPTNHLDIDSIQRLLAAVEAIEPQPAVLLITHDQELAGWADRAVWLEEGRAHRWRPMTRSE